MPKRIIPFDLNLSYPSIRSNVFSILSLQGKQLGLKSSLPKLLFCLVAVVLLLISPFAQAAIINWTGTTGDWSDPNNWGGTEPTSSDGAFIANDGTATVTQSDETCNGLYLGNSGTGHSGNIQMTGGSLTVSYGEEIGNTGIGTFIQSGGTNTIVGNQGLILGEQTGSVGTYNLSDSGQLLSPERSLVTPAPAVLINPGGNNLITGNLSLGSYGTYTLSGSGLLTLGTTGTLNVGSGRLEWFVNSLTTPTLTCGTSGTLAVGFDCDLNSLVGGTLYHGSAITGLTSLEITNNASVTQSGSSSLSLGQGGSGTLTIGSSTGNGTLNWNSTGKLSTYNQYIGSAGTSTFNQSTGTNNMGVNLYLGFKSSDSGIYNLSGSGILSANNQYIGYSGSGTITHSGGTNTGGAIYLGYNAGSAGTYNLTNSATMNGSVYVGYSGSGVFNQTGGTSTSLSSSYLGYNPQSSGTYFLSGGVVT